MAQIPKALADLAARLRAKLLATQTAIRPTISATVTPTTLNGAGTVTIQATVTNATSVEVYRDGTKVATLTSAPYEFSDPISGGTGVRAYRLVARNTTQSAEATAALTLNIPLPDILPPVVVLTPGTLRVTAAGPVPLSATVVDLGGVASVKFYRGETLLGTRTSEPYTITDTLGYADNGEVVYTAVATDLAGNVGASVPVPVAVAIPDTVAPVVTLAASSTNITANGTLTLTAEATDAGGVASVKLYRDTTLLATLAAPPYTVSESVTASANGTYLYKAVATDKAGNTSQATQSVTINITRSAPAGALAHYTMDAGADAGLLYDSSGNGHTLTLGSGAGADGADPVYDGVGGLVFGGDDRVPLNLADVTPDVVTVVIQARADGSINGNRRVFGVQFADGSIWEIYREASQGILAVRTQVSGVFAYPNFSQPWAAGGTLFLAVRVDRAAGQFALSVNGGAFQVYRTVAAITEAPVAAYLGADSSGGNGWQGTLGDTTIYGRGLTDAEVADLYTLTTPLATPPVSAASLTNDGDAFTLSWPSSSSLQYVVYSAYADTGRQWVPISPWVRGTTFRDPNVYDGQAVWYQIYRMVDGVEVLHAELNGVQPDRVWEAAATLEPGVYQNRRWRSMDPAVPDVTLRDGQSAAQEYVFINCDFGGKGRGVKGFRNRVRMRGCRSWRQHPGGIDKLHGNFLHLESFRNVDVQFCYSEGQFSCYFTAFDNRGAPGDTLKFNYNFVRNVMNQRTDGAGGYKVGSEDFSRGQAIQVSTCQSGQVDNSGAPITYRTNLRGAEIIGNYVHNEADYSRVEDIISMYKVKGYADSLVRIEDNFLYGAWTYRVAVHTGYSGGGIMIGDEGGSYISQSRNFIVAASNYGIAILNGEGNRANDNRVTRAPTTWDGRRIAVAPPSGLVGAQMWDYNRVGTAMKNNQMNGNLLRNQYQKADGTTVTNNKYVTMADKNGNTFSGNTLSTGPVTQAMEQGEFPIWRDRMDSAGTAFGPQAYAA